METTTNSVPHPSSWRALQEQLEQETAGRKLAEALLEKVRGELEAMTRESLRLKALILGVHLSHGEELDGACILLDEEGQRIHGCQGGPCDDEVG